MIPTSIELDTDVREVNFKEMNMLFYYQIKSLKSKDFFKNIPFEIEKFFKNAELVALNEFY